MSTPWFTSTTAQIVQIDDTDATWDGDFGSLRTLATGSVKSGLLQCRHNDFAGGHIRNKTAQIKLSGWDFSNLPQYIQGMELHISCNKQGRIVEDQCHFVDSNRLVSLDRFKWNGQELSYFHADYDNEAYYGGPTDTWGLDFSQVLLDSNFILNLRYQSNFFFPHRDSIILNTVRLRFY
jgi:hypothetical protein